MNQTRKFMKQASFPSMNFICFDDDFDHFEPMLNAAMQAIPSLSKIGVKKNDARRRIFHPRWQFYFGTKPPIGKITL